MFISKRILIIISILGIIIVGSLGFTIFLLLNQSNANATSASAAFTPTAVATTSRSTTTHICATGAISSIDTRNSTIVVMEAKGARSVTVTTDSQTTFHKRGVTGVTFNSLAVGQRVRVTSQAPCGTTAATFTAKAVTIIVPTTSTPTTSPTATP